MAAAARCFFDGMGRIDRIAYPDRSEATFDHDNGNIVAHASPLALRRCKPLINYPQAC